jgi:hypothetical protein
MLVAAFAAGFLAAESRTVPPLACLQTASHDRGGAIPVSTSTQGATPAPPVIGTVQCAVSRAPLSRVFSQGGS